MKSEEKVKQLGPWFHNIHLPDGTQTCSNHFLGDFPTYKWHQISPFIPENLDGWKVLDIGCNAGYYSIELAKRGAEVTGIDIDTHYLKQARWVAQEFGLDDRIEYKQMQVYDLAQYKEEFNLIWFMGVFYHLRYPLLALDIISLKNNNKLIFQTLSIPGNDKIEDTYDRLISDREDLHHRGWPKMAFIEHSFAGDPTNWWLPNHSAIEAMLHSCGYNITNMPGHEIYICEKDSTRQNVAATWNHSEYLSAIQKAWKESEMLKIRKN